MKLVQGTTYKAEVALGFVEAMASNEQVAAKFREVGFTDVTVTGTGKARTALGTWPNGTREVDLPKQVTHASEA